MLKNILIYLAVLICAFVFCIFYYAWFSWYLFIVIACIPLLSLTISMPFMIFSAVRGFSASCTDCVYKNQSVKIWLGSKNGKPLFIPFLKIKFKTDNSFSKKRGKVTFRCGGMIKKGAALNDVKISENCGNVEIKAKYAKIYDLSGIFFIPIKLNVKLNTLVIPKPVRPELLPESDCAAIVSYKPKPGGGFSDFYELRQYINGDSLKSIHWKLSSKYDDLIVREPSEPIYSRLVIKTDFGATPAENDSVLAKAVYVCRFFIKNETPFFAFDGQSGVYLQIKSEKDVQTFLRSVFSEEKSNSIENMNDCVIYTIHPDFEEVSKA